MNNRKQYIFKRTKTIHFCKKCGIAFHSHKKLHFGLCSVHRKPVMRAQYQKAKAEGRINKELRYKNWKKWVVENIDRRRQLALESYHRNKNKPSNKMRKHRATKKDNIL